MRLSVFYFVILTLFESSLSEPDIEQSLANFRKALGTKLLAVETVSAPKPPVVLISAPAKPIHTNLGILQNYLGTETKNETAEAIQGVNNLVISGILPDFKPINVNNILSPLSESNPDYAGTKKPCHHKEDVVANKDTELRPFSDSHNNNTPLPQTAKPCHHKESFIQKPLSHTETPLQPNKDLTAVTKKPCDHSSVQTITSTVELNSNSDKLDIIEQRPILSPIPAAPQLPPWHVPIAGQVLVAESTYIPDNQLTLVQPGLSIGSSFSYHDCNKDKIEIVERPVPSLIPAAPQLPPWQFSANGQFVVEETSYIPDNHVTFAQHVPIPIPEPPQLQPLLQVPVSGQVVVEENAYVSNKPCPYKTYDRTNVVYNQGPINLPPVFADSPVPVNLVHLPVKVPAKVSIPQPVIETIAEPMPIPLEVDVPSSYTYQQVKGDGSVETTFALQDGVHVRYVPNPYTDVKSYEKYYQRPNDFITTNIKSYHDSVYQTVNSQYNQYPHIETGFNEFTEHNLPYNYNQYPAQQQISQRPYNPYQSVFNNAPRPQVNNYYQPGRHVHPQSFNHPQHQQLNNFGQPSYGGYSYKQIHGDGSITSYHGTDGNIQTLKSGLPHLSASNEVAKKPAPQVPFANIVRQPQSFNVSPNQMIGDLTPGHNPMYFSYMFKQLGFNGAANESGSKSKVMESPTALPVVNTNVRKPETGLPVALSNVDVTSYSAFTNGNNKVAESNSEAGGFDATGYTRDSDKSVTEVNKSGPGFKVSYGIGEKTNSKKHSIEYNPIIVLDTTTSAGTYYYSQSGSDGFKTEYIGDKDKVVVQNADDIPKVNERRRGDIAE